MATPLIAEIKNQGGTVYTFQSANEDFNFSMGSARKEFKFSKFVLLNLPDIKDGSTGYNTTSIDNIPSSYLKIDTSDWNQSFAENFQNYCLNLESMILSSDTYDSTKNSTVSERVFWKWLKEMGAVRFREAEVGNPEDGGERTRRTEDSLLIADTNIKKEIGKRFVEEDERSVVSGNNYPYTRVVQYIGNIDVVNSVKYNGSSFLELYFMVPVETGNTPKVLFKSIINDSNYQKNAIYKHIPANGLSTEYILGRASTDTHPTGLDMRAHFDADGSTFTQGSSGVDSYALSIKKNGEDSYSSGWWFTSPDPNSYYLEPTQLNDYRNDWMKITGYRNSTSNNKEFIRSRLDGISIDFDLANSYSDNLTGEYKSFEDYNKATSSKDFQFNTMLIYYDLVDLDDPTKITTNLYSVWFMDKWKDGTSSSAVMERYKKFKPSKTSRNGGNSYGFKLNLKQDLNAQDSIVTSSVNEYNNYSLHLYNDALQVMKDYASKQIDLLSSNALLKSKIEFLEDLILNGETLASIDSRVSTIETSLTSSNALIADIDSVMSLISKTYNEVLNIYKNYTSVEMSYNIDVIKQGRGITLDKTNPGSVIVNSDVQSYSLNDKPIVEFKDLILANNSNVLYHTHTLKPNSNYVKFVNVATERTGNINLDGGQMMYLYIDDKGNTWTKGQSMRISFQHQYNFTVGLEKAFVVYTDSTNRKKNSTEYGVEVCYLKPEDFVLSNMTPIIEIVCIDDINLKFTMDILK